MRAIGKTTRDAMMSGAVFGYRGLVREILVRVSRENFSRSKPRIVATGGYAQLIARKLPEIEAVHPNLTLEGLRIIANRNVGKTDALMSDEDRNWNRLWRHQCEAGRRFWKQRSLLGRSRFRRAEHDSADQPAGRGLSGCRRSCANSIPRFALSELDFPESLTD